MARVERAHGRDEADALSARPRGVACGSKRERVSLEFHGDRTVPIRKRVRQASPGLAAPGDDHAGSARRDFTQTSLGSPLSVRYTGGRVIRSQHRRPIRRPPSSSGPLSLDSGDPAHYLNRELSWLEFNARVLAEAGDRGRCRSSSGSSSSPSSPRTSTSSSWCASPACRRRRSATIAELPPDGLTAARAARRRSAQRVARARRRAVPALEHRDDPGARSARASSSCGPKSSPPTELAALDERFRTDIFPVLTPLAIDPGHPFPHLRNKSLNLGIMFSREHEAQEPGFGVVQVPAMLQPPRCAVRRRRARSRAFVLLEDLIARHVKEFFPRRACAAPTPSASRATGTSRSTRKKARTCSRRSRTSSAGASAATPCASRSAGRGRRRERRSASARRSSSTRRTTSTACRGRSTSPTCMRHRRRRRAARAARRAVHAAGRCRRSATPTTSSPSSASATCSCTTRTSRSTRSSSSSRARPTIPNVLAIKQTLYRTGGDSPIVQGARARRRERQAGHRDRRAQGALRRGEQHPVGAHARAERRARRSTACSA